MPVTLDYCFLAGSHSTGITNTDDRMENPAPSNHLSQGGLVIQFTGRYWEQHSLSDNREPLFNSDIHT